MKLFSIERLTPVLALACALAVFVAAALDPPEATPGTAAIATGVR